MNRANLLTLIAFTVIVAFVILTLVTAASSTNTTTSKVLLVVCGIFIAFIALSGAVAINISNELITGARREIQRLNSAVVTADKANHQFWSNVSHELRTPLNSILGYTELLLDSNTVQRDTSVLADIEKVQAAGNELLALVNDVLSVSGSDEVDLSHYRETTDLSELIQQIAAAIQPLAERIGVEIRIATVPGPQIVQIDARKLERLLLSLLTNIIKSIEEGMVSISVSVPEPQPSTIAISITHPGSGIDPGQLGSLSKPFELTSDAEYSTLRSTDLTLAVCKKLVHELGGSIIASHEPETGSSYLLTLPVVVESGKEARKRIDNNLTPDILIIDEFDDSAELLARYLKRLHCKVTVSNDGADGKEIAVLLQPELIVLDVDLRSIDGWAILQHLKFDSRTRNIPVIVTSIRN
ncbi:MAG: histidine kinase dimerization/phospho-acceptor domain-containing protein, partial [Pseudomonadales bacterium]